MPVVGTALRMQRRTHPTRADWRRKVESVGLAWHSAAGPYWNEEAHYAFSAAEVDAIEGATNALHAMCLEAAQHVIAHRQYDRLAIPPAVVPLIEASWAQEPPSLYGRFDLAYDGMGPPKLLEYNADTPTSLVEASLAQWFWLQDTHPQLDQFNALHERLIAHWRHLAPHLQGDVLHFVGMDDLEDGVTLAYLRDTAEQAGIRCATLPIRRIGLTGDETFVPSASPIVRIGTDGLLEAARTAQACGARRLVVVSPLAALLQMNAGTHAAGSADEIALMQMNFEQLVIVRPTAADAEPAGSLPQRLVRSAARALADIMLPAYARALSAPLAARAIVEAVAQAPAGLSVLGARELMARIEADGRAPKRPRLGAFADRRTSR